MAGYEKRTISSRLLPSARYGLSRVPTLLGPEGLGTAAVEYADKAARTSALSFEMPVPDNGTRCGLPPSLSLIKTSAPNDPFFLGTKVTAMMQDFPAPRLVQLFV
jgi:hypothetical protein